MKNFKTKKWGKNVPKGIRSSKVICKEIDCSCLYVFILICCNDFIKHYFNIVSTPSEMSEVF